MMVTSPLLYYFTLLMKEIKYKFKSSNTRNVYIRNYCIQLIIIAVHDEELNQSASYVVVFISIF